MHKVVPHVWSHSQIPSRPKRGTPSCRWFWDDCFVDWGYVRLGFIFRRWVKIVALEVFDVQGFRVNSITIQSYSPHQCFQPWVRYQKPHSFSRSHPILPSPHRASLGGLKWQCFIHSGPNSGSPSHKAFEISEMKLVGFMGLHDNYIQLLMNLSGYCTLYTLLFDMLSSLKTSDPSP